MELTQIGFFVGGLGMWAVWYFGPHAIQEYCKDMMHEVRINEIYKGIYRDIELRQRIEVMKARLIVCAKMRSIVDYMKHGGKIGIDLNESKNVEAA